MPESERKPYRGIGMEGRIASWYAKTTGKDLGEFRRVAERLAKDLTEDGRVLEVAPGPGYLSVALAKLGPYKITGLDISQTFVRMASAYAQKEGVKARFIHGNASDIPFEDGFFDLIVCRAAFKNFTEPLRALNEMRRVLRPTGHAVIIDLRKDASWNEIVSHVDRMNLGMVNTWFTKITFKGLLLKRAYTEEQINSLATASDFQSCQITANSIGMEIRLPREQSIAQVA